MKSLKIAAAQIGSVRGDLSGNIEKHLVTIQSASVHNVSVLVFPELSLIGYEPDLATNFALAPTDRRLAAVSQLASRHRMHIVIGASVANRQGKPFLGSFVFGDDGSISTYAKMHLGGDEPAHFASGNTPMSIVSHGEIIGLCICADSSEPAHPAAFASKGATVYLASVFLNAEWYASDLPRFAKYAADFGMLVMMANHAQSQGTLVSVGNSAAWLPDGSLAASAYGTKESLVLATRTNNTWNCEVLALS